MDLNFVETRITYVTVNSCMEHFQLAITERLGP
jgi:hypothetical protein